MRPEDFLEITRNQQKITIPFQLGTIPVDYVSGRPQVQFDGESNPSTRTYPYLDNYTPTAEDRVLVAMVGSSGVILGKVV